MNTLFRESQSINKKWGQKEKKSHSYLGPGFPISWAHKPNTLDLINWGPSQIIHISANYKGVLWLCISCLFRMDLLRTNCFGYIVIMIGNNCQCVFLLNIDTVKWFGDSEQPWSISLLRTLVRTTSNFLRIPFLEMFLQVKVMRLHKE